MRKAKKRYRKTGKLTALAGACVLASLGALSACSSDDPTGTSSGEKESTASSLTEGEGSDGATPEGSGTLVMGSQQYYSNEIIAEIFAQKLESEGYTIDRQYQIGQREIFIPEIESGKIDIIPEYSGNLLQYYDGETTARSRDEVLSELQSVLPDNLRILEAAEATDQDSLTITKELSQRESITSIADLKNVDWTIKVGANSEFQTRPFGVPGLKEHYGLDVQLLPIEDSGGPLTVKALLEDKVQLANIYTASPAIAENDLVVLEDPENIFLPQNVVPVVSKNVDESAAAAINEVSAKLSSDELRKLNQISVEEQLDSAVIAKQWLADQGLVSE